MASRLCCSADDRSGSPDAPNARHPVSAEVQRNLLPRSYQRDTHVITPNVWPAIIAPGERKPLLDIFPPTTSDENPNPGSHTDNEGAGTAPRPPKTIRRFNITARIKKKLSQESTHAKKRSPKQHWPNDTAQQPQVDKVRLPKTEEECLDEEILADRVPSREG